MLLRYLLFPVIILESEFQIKTRLMMASYPLHAFFNAYSFKAVNIPYQ